MQLPTLAKKLPRVSTSLLFSKNEPHSRTEETITFGKFSSQREERRERAERSRWRQAGVTFLFHNYPRARSAIAGKKGAADHNNEIVKRRALGSHMADPAAKEEDTG